VLSSESVDPGATTRTELQPASKMRAWRVYGPNDFRLDTVPAPRPALGEALLQVLVVQPSITEVLGLRGGGLGAPQVAAAASTGTPAQLFGHEFCARVLEVNGIEGQLAVGDRVTALGRIPCGRCPECKRGEPQHCSSGEMVGITRPGCYAEFVCLPSRVLTRVPESVSDAEAASLQPLASVNGALRSLAPSIRGRDVAILGLGLMGLLSAQVVAAMGARRVFGVTSRAPAAFALGQTGIEGFSLPADADAVRSESSRCSLVIDCSGMLALPGLGCSTIDLAFDLAEQGGTVLQVAIYDGPVMMDTGQAKRKCLRYVWPEFSTHDDLVEAASLVGSGKVRLAPFLQRSVEGIEALPTACAWTLSKSADGTVGPVQAVFAR
jgi:threonine dehydrogenase-like Zn-dependent dehydrogenase